MATVGRADVKIVADTRGFARDAEREINRALGRVDVDTRPISRGIVQGTTAGIVAGTSDLAVRFVSNLGRAIQGGITGPPFGQLLAGAFLLSLGPVMTAVGGGLAGTFVTAFAGGLGALGIVFAAQSEEIQTRFSNLFSQIQILGERLAEPFVPALQQIATLVFQNLISPFSEFSMTLGQVFEVLAPAFVEFADALTQALVALSPAFVPLSEAFAVLVEELTPTLISESEELADALIGLAEAVSQNPAAFVRLIELFFDILQVSVNLLSFFSDFAGIMDVVRVSFRQGGDQVSTFIRILFDLPQLLDELIEGLDDTFNAVVGFATGFADSASQLASDVFRSFTDLGNTISDFIVDLLRQIGDIPARVIEAFAGLGSALFEAGRAAIEGFIDGLLSQVGRIDDILGDIAGRVTSFWPFSPAERGPLRTHPPEEWGRNIGAGLTAGLLDSLPEIGRATDAMAGQTLGGPAQANNQFDVRVFMGDRELTDIIDVQIDNRNILNNIAALAGSGAAA